MTIKSLPTVLAALLGSACGGSQRPAPTPTDDIHAWLQQIPAAYERGDATIFENRLDPDGLFIGTAPEEVWDAPTFMDVHRQMLGKVAAGQMTWKVTFKDLAIDEAPDKKSAWMSMEVDWQFGGSAQAVPSRWSGVLFQRGGRWVLSASEVSFGVPGAEAFQMAASGRLVPSKPIADRIDPGAEELVAVFDRDLAVPRRLLSDLHLGDVHDTLKRAGVRAHLAPGGQLGWVMTNVEDTVEPTPGTQVTLPIRALAVYVREGGAWKLVHSHTSNAVPNG